MVEEILERQPCLYPLTPGVHRIPFTTPFHQGGLPNPYGYQCNPDSKIFGSIPIGTIKFISITEGLRQVADFYGNEPQNLLKF